MMLTRFAIVLVLACYGDAVKILGIFPFTSGSHYILDYKLMKGLADAGNDVTMVNAFPQKTVPKTKGNFTEIILEGFKEKIEKRQEEMDIFALGDQNMAILMFTLLDMMKNLTRDTLHHPQLQELAKSGQKFDAVIIENFHTDAMKVYGSLFNCPLIVLFSLGPNGWINPTIGNPKEISYMRHMYSPGNPEEPMTFLDRVMNLIFTIFDYFFTQYYILTTQDKILREVYPEAPTIQDLYTNASLVLLNSHTSLYPPQPLVPNMIEIGGYHVDPPKKLPRDLQEFLDNATDGAIYFSMGSNLKSKKMPDEKKKVILNVLKKLKQKVIWKFEEDLPGKPDNVLIKNWLPQQDILAHPNIRLFITHGGLLSTTETIYHGVPILAIPVFGDQPANAQKAEYAGYALQISYFDKDFTEERLSGLIEELLSNPKYRENAQRRSKLFHDRPMKPMDTAVYWIEYVVRNNGARHLRVAGINQPWYQYYMIDVALFLILSILVILNLFIVIAKVIIRRYIFKSTKQQKLKKQ